MKKVLPYILHLICFIILAVVIILSLEFIFKIEVSPWVIAIISAVITLVIPQFKNIETQSGTKLQVKWWFNSFRK